MPQKTTLCLIECRYHIKISKRDSTLPNIDFDVTCVLFPSAGTVSSLLFLSFSLLCCVLRPWLLEEGCVSSTATHVIRRGVLTPDLHSLLPFVAVKKVQHTGTNMTYWILHSCFLTRMSACESCRQQQQLRGRFRTCIHCIHPEPRIFEKSAAY